jgi:hypothetical protein
MVGKREERGSKEGITREKSHIWAVSCTLPPHRGKGTRESPSSYLSHTHPCGKAEKRKEPESKLR